MLKNHNFTIDSPTLSLVCLTFSASATTDGVEDWVQGAIKDKKKCERSKFK
jgi:hypothetical protein